MPSGARGTRPRPGEWAPGGGGPSAEVAEQLVGVDGRAAGPACLITGEGPRRAQPWQGAGVLAPSAFAAQGGFWAGSCCRSREVAPRALRGGGAGMWMPRCSACGRLMERPCLRPGLPLS